MSTPGSHDYICTDYLCHRCGYNLHGLAPEALCPECGSPVAPSLKSRLLKDADRRWALRLARGGLFGCFAMASIAAGFALTILRAGSNSEIFWLYGSLLLALALGLAGSCQACSREPAGPYFDDAPKLRWAARTIFAVSFGCMCAYSLIQVLDRHMGYRDSFVLWQNIVGWPAFAGGLVGSALFSWHLSRLAARIPNRKLQIAGRLTAFSPLILAVLVFAVALLLTRGSTAAPAWLVVGIYESFFVWPGAYYLAWHLCARRVVRA